jgi:hypothetical protein
MKPNTNLDYTVRVPVREIHEIEFSSRCNLACRYCPHPTMSRAKADMQVNVFWRTLSHLQHLCDAGTQGEVSLTGIGEAILHPQFVPWMHEVRSVIGRHRRLVVATNGVALDRPTAEAMAKAGALVYVSLHRPEKAGPAYELLKEVGCAVGTNSAFVDEAIDWAGQVPWHTSAGLHGCAYLMKGWCAVRQDGSVNTCCMDADSLEPVSHVNDEIGSLTTRATRVCDGCHLAAPAEFRLRGEWPDELVKVAREVAAA